MKKVVLINNGELPLPNVKGGAVETLIQLLIDENEKNHQIDLHVCCVADEKAKQASCNYKNTTFHYHKRYKKGVDFLYKCANYILKRLNLPSCGNVYQNGIVKSLKIIQPDLVVLEGCPNFAERIKRKVCCKVVARYHNLPTKVMMGWDRMNYEATDLFIGISDYVSNCVRNHFADIDKKVVTVYNSVDDEVLNSNENLHRDIREELGIPKSDFVFLYTGRIQPYKGVLELLKAFSLLSQEQSNIRLLIVGSNTFSSNKLSNFEEECHSLVETLGDKVRFTGYIPYQTIGAFYHAANVGVFPSTWEEPFALTCLESLMCGLPCIITKSGGMPEIVDGNCAIIVDKDMDLVSRLKEAMQRIISDVNFYEKAKTHSLERAQLFNKKNHFSKYLEVMNTL